MSECEETTKEHNLSPARLGSHYGLPTAAYLVSLSPLLDDSFLRKLDPLYHSIRPQYHHSGL